MQAEDWNKLHDCCLCDYLQKMQHQTWQIDNTRFIVVWP